MRDEMGYSKTIWSLNVMGIHQKNVFDAAPRMEEC